MVRKKVVFSFAVIIVLVLIALIFYFTFPIADKSVVEQKVKRFYELANPGITAEVVATTEQSGLYKMVLKVSSIRGISFLELWATKDGKLLTQNLILVEESLTQLQNLKNFVDCLDSNGVRIFGQSNQSASLLQLNLLGTFSPKLFVACEGANLQACLDIGIREIPSIVYGNTSYPGVKDISWFEIITGCKLGS